MFLNRYPPEEWCPPHAFNEEHQSFGHFPVPKQLFGQPVGVAMFRHPVRRLYSAYAHGKHRIGMHWEKAAILKKNVSTPLEYVRFPGIAGCSTKMMLGKPCSGPFQINNKAVVRAILSLRTNLAFVGITEAWNESVCLFHAMFGGRATAASFENVRPAVARNHTYNAENAKAQISIQDDPFDYRLYKAAKTLFVQRLHQYGIKVPASLNDPLDARLSASDLEDLDNSQGDDVENNDDDGDGNDGSDGGDGGDGGGDNAGERNPAREQ